MSRLAAVAAAALIATAAAGCPGEEPIEDDLILVGLTTAPPASEATILNSDTEGYAITLSRGIAMAARCWDSCTSTCEAPSFTVADPLLLEVRPLWRPGGDAADVVLVATGSGTTSLRVQTACTTRTYPVTVLDR